MMGPEKRRGREGGKTTYHQQTESVNSIQFNEKFYRCIFLSERMSVRPICFCQHVFFTSKFNIRILELELGPNPERAEEKKREGEKRTKRNETKRKKKKFKSRGS